MRKPIIAGNWKMNKTPDEAVALIEELKPLVADAEAETVVCVPFTDILAAKGALEGSNIGLGAQNMDYHDAGAFTGEVSPDMLLALGVQYVILGHSERRAYYGETDENVNKKVLKALEKGLTPIVCVGEKLEEREDGITHELVAMQTKLALKDVPKDKVADVVIAYEPIWAIGTGKTATAKDANDTIHVIRETVREIAGPEAADAIRIQYGGSMNAGNAKELMEEPDIDGGLIGGASLKAPDFAKVVHHK